MESRVLLVARQITRRFQSRRTLGIAGTPGNGTPRAINFFVIIGKNRRAIVFSSCN